MKHRKILIMSNVAIIAYYAAFLLWAELSQPGEGETVVMHAYSGFLALINPFTIGAYLLGIVALLNLKYCRRKAYRITFFLLYCIVAACTLVAVMGMTHWWELLMYVPHLIILILAMILVSHRIDSKVKS
jgi:membrane-associated HD superfamily phosphohydrolase